MTYIFLNLVINNKASLFLIIHFFFMHEMIYIYNVINARRPSYNALQKAAKLLNPYIFCLQKETKGNALSNNFHS